MREVGTSSRRAKPCERGLRFFFLRDGRFGLTQTGGEELGPPPPRKDCSSASNCWTRSCKSCSWASNCELSWINSSRLAFSRSIITHEVYTDCQSLRSFAAWNSEQLPLAGQAHHKSCRM